MTGVRGWRVEVRTVGHCWRILGMTGVRGWGVFLVSPDRAATVHLL